MTKKVFALAAAATLVLLLPTIAAATSSQKSTPHFSGTISSWDDAAKQSTVKESNGKERSFGWNEKTTVTGAPKVGEHASVKYTKDKAGKIWATHLTIGAHSASTKPPTSK